MELAGPRGQTWPYVLGNAATVTPSVQVSRLQRALLLSREGRYWCRRTGEHGLGLLGSPVFGLDVAVLPGGAE